MGGYTGAYSVDGKVNRAAIDTIVPADEGLLLGATDARADCGLEVPPAFEVLAEPGLPFRADCGRDERAADGGRGVSAADMN